MRSAPSPVVTLLFAAAVFAAVSLYRFNLLGGQLGGLENDEFLVVSRAAAMLHGDLPSRDFTDPGYPLAYVASALAMHATGGTLFGHALLAVGMLALGGALTYLVGLQASGSHTVGLVAALVQTSLGPRLYNYPKIVVYAAAVLALWAYARRPGTARLAVLAVITAAGFLFRHDHGIYVGAATAILLGVMARETGVRTAVRQLLAFALLTLACLAPYLVFVQQQGGLIAHLQTGAEFSRVDRDRTRLRPPQLTVDWRAPLVAIEPAGPVPHPRVTVRWRDGAAPDGPALASFARAHRATLASATSAGAELEILDPSPDNLQRLATDPLVADTSNIDRAAWRIREAPRVGWWQELVRRTPLLRARVAPGVLTGDNAVVFVYYLWLALPLLAAATAALMVWRYRDAAAWMDLYRVAPVAVVMLLLNQWFLRGTLPVRLADVSVLAAACGAFVVGRLLRARQIGGLARGLALGLAAVVAGLAIASSMAVGRVPTNLRVMTDGDGLAGVTPRTEAVAAFLDTPGPELADRLGGGSPLMALAAYLHACLGPDDRPLVVAYLPEVFFFSDRRFAGGAVDLRAGYLNVPRDQDQLIARVRQQSVPVVVTEAAAVFEERYENESPILRAYLDRAYRDTGDHDFAGQPYRLLVRRDFPRRPALDAARRPCFR
jgi:hypothetical protein